MAALRLGWSAAFTEMLITLGLAETASLMASMSLLMSPSLLLLCLTTTIEASGATPWKGTPAT